MLLQEGLQKRKEFSAEEVREQLFMLLWRFQKDLSENDIVVFIVCDTGERYLSKVHNIEWLRNNRMLETEIKILRDISDAKKLKGNEDIVFVHPGNSCKRNLKNYSG